ncbi:hypothetical protein ABZS88_43985 [Streptomyces sp. NPDC005480]|uniref:hypothetical protein n=1 Tax=Streptomyces sp. NPDC005480 TaxID=3154880 RepID=UPI0033BF2C70
MEMAVVLGTDVVPRRRVMSRVIDQWTIASALVVRRASSRAGRRLRIRWAKRCPTIQLGQDHEAVHVVAALDDREDQGEAVVRAGLPLEQDPDGGAVAGAAATGSPLCRQLTATIRNGTAVRRAPLKIGTTTAAQYR